MSSTTSVDLLAPVHRLSVEQYVAIAEQGHFDDGPTVELIDGILVEMSPIGTPHLLAVMWLNRELVPQLSRELILAVQQSVRIEDLYSLPQPDLAVVDVAVQQRGVADRPALVIEVSASSLRFDRITKARLYARNDVQEYWIVNLRDQVLECHRSPVDGAWTDRTVHEDGAVVRSTAVEGLQIDLGELFAFAAGAPADD